MFISASTYSVGAPALAYQTGKSFRNCTSSAAVLLIFSIVFSGCLMQGGQTLNSASAVEIKKVGQLIGGPAASGRIGDILMQNHRVRFIIQQTKGAGGEILREQNIAPYGGTVIDADFIRLPGEAGHDIMGEVAVFYNLGRTARYTEVRIIDDGSTTGTAIVEATGRGVTLTNLNVNSAIDSFAGGIGSALLGDFNPDTDLGLSIVTRYILHPDQDRLEIQTTFSNNSGSTVTVLPGDIIDSGGAVEPFFVADNGILDARHGSRGFGEQPDDLGANGVEMLAFRGATISYGYIPLLPGQTTGGGLTVCALLVGVGVCNLGAEITLGGLNSVTLNGFGAMPEFTDTAFADVAGDFLSVPASGAATYRRYIVVGNTSISSLTDQLEKLYGEQWTTLNGSAKQGSAPLADVDIAILRVVEGDVVPYSAVRTDADGAYGLRLPKGEYVVLPNRQGYDVPKPAYYGGGSAASQRIVIGSADVKHTITLDPFVFAAPGRVKVYVQDDQREPIPARIFIFGKDPSRDVIVSGGGSYDLFPAAIAGSADLLYPFRDLTTDPLPSNAATDVTLTDWQGDTATVGRVQIAAFAELNGQVSINLEPGVWTIVATHGMEYDYDLLKVTVTAGGTAIAALQLPRAVDSYGWFGGDLHVHAINSPDAPTENRDRILSFLADGVDYLVASDHGYRTDYAPVIASMEGDWDEDGKSDIKGRDLLLSIVGEEVTTWDFGHFNAFPLRRAKDAPRHPELLDGSGANDWEDAKTASTTGGSMVWWQDDANGGTGYVSTTTDIFAALRKDVLEGAEASQVIQVNHPFTGDFQAHFDVMQLNFDFSGRYSPVLDDYSAIVLDIPKGDQLARRFRLLENGESYYGDDFDLIELLNGTDYNALWKGMSYWFGFLNVGKLVSATGNSDTHDLNKLASGTPRTYVPHSAAVDRAGSLDDANEVPLALRNGHSFISSGYFVSVTGSLIVTSGSGAVVSAQHDLAPRVSAYVAKAGDKGINSAEAAQGYAAHLTLYVDVQSPRWAPPARIDVYSLTPFVHKDDIGDTSYKSYDKYLNAQAVTTWVAPAAATPPEFVEESGFVYAFSDEITRYTPGTRWHVRTAFSLPAITGPTELSWDRWYVVRVLGTESGFPVLFHEDEKVVPVALVNPIRIDLDGNGWLSPCGLTAPDVPARCRIP